MNRPPFQVEYPTNEFIRALKTLHQELAQMKLPSFQNITEEMLLQLGHLERSFIAVTHCVSETPEWQNRSNTHEQYGLERQDYWRIRESMQLRWFSAQWTAVVDILGGQPDRTKQLNVLNAALSINEEIRSMYIDPWPDDRMPKDVVVYKNDSQWEEQIERNKELMEEYKWKLYSANGAEGTKQVILDVFNETENREVRLLLLCVGIQRLKTQTEVFTPGHFKPVFMFSEPDLFSMIDRIISSFYPERDDVYGFKTWAASERKKCKGFLFVHDAQVGPAIDRVIDAFEECADGTLFVLYINKHRINEVATIISGHLELPLGSVKNALKKTYPAAFSCGGKENALRLKEKLVSLCVCCC